jgi:hypothetical protein
MKRQLLRKILNFNSRSWIGLAWTMRWPLIPPSTLTKILSKDHRATSLFQGRLLTKMDNSRRSSDSLWTKQSDKLTKLPVAGNRTLSTNQASVLCPKLAWHLHMQRLATKKFRTILEHPFRLMVPVLHSPLNPSKLTRSSRITYSSLKLSLKECSWKQHLIPSPSWISHLSLLVKYKLGLTSMTKNKNNSSWISTTSQTHQELSKFKWSKR